MLNAGVKIRKVCVVACTAAEHGFDSEGEPLDGNVPQICQAFSNGVDPGASGPR